VSKENEQPRRFAVVDKGGNVWAAYEHVESAWARTVSADKEFPRYGPHSVFELVPVPKPVPPRPSVRVQGVTITYDGRCYVGSDQDDIGDGSVADVVYSLTVQRKVWPTDAQLRALLDLPEATRAWEREHGGAA
jgi:hypothetical protein